jgi:signal transduction histidine kinase
MSQQSQSAPEKIRILVVDDAKVVLNFYQKGLSRIGYEVDVADSAIKALDMIEKKDYDIVITDINMELMDGIELLEAIKRDYPHIEVIMMTGYATVENAIRSLKKGAYDFLMKPVKLEQVRQVVKHCEEKIRISQEIQQLRKINERLREVQEMKNRFIAITSHELRTPVTHIKSYLDFLRDPAFSEEEKKEFLDIIQKSVDDLERIVLQMFEVSRIEGNELPLNKEKTQIVNIVRDCLQQMKIELRERDLEIIHKEEEDLPEVPVDPFRIKEVIMEILNNAIRFTPDGGKITISYDHNSKYLSILIQDTGVGIPEDKLGRIFEKFYEVQDSSYHTSSRIQFMGGSTGIGLPLAKGLVEAHGGRLKIESEVSKGTKVWIYLPLFDPAESSSSSSKKAQYAS